MFGLLLSAVMSVFNVFTDISRKKVLDRQYDAALISFWCKAVAIFAYAAGIGILVLRGAAPELPDIGKSLNIAPAVAFLLYLLLNAVLEGTAILLQLRPLQVSPISLCTPFLTMTPLFLLPAGRFLLGESISAGMVLGVCLVVFGSLIVNRQLFAQGPFEPVKAIFRERGCRYMLMVALLLAITNVLDKWFVTTGGTAPFDIVLSRALTLSIGKCMMLGLFFVGLTVARLGRWNQWRQRSTGLARAALGFNWIQAWREVPAWLLLAGLLEAVVLVLQLAAMQLTVAALVISIKRAGVVLSVLLGRLIFKERGITDRMIASLVMLAGVLIFFLTKPDAAGLAVLGFPGAAAISLGAALGAFVALYLTANVIKKGS